MPLIEADGACGGFQAHGPMAPLDHKLLGMRKERTANTAPGGRRVTPDAMQVFAISGGCKTELQRAQ